MTSIEVPNDQLPNRLKPVKKQADALIEDSRVDQDKDVRNVLEKKRKALRGNLD